MFGSADDNPEQYVEKMSSLMFLAVDGCTDAKLIRLGRKRSNELDRNE